MEKTHAVKLRLSDVRRDDVIPGTPAERIGLVWPLTREVVSLSGRIDDERRLQREMTVVRRWQGQARERRPGQTNGLADAEALERLGDFELGEPAQ